MRGLCMLALAAFLMPAIAHAQGAAPQAKPEMSESCPGMVARNSPRIVPASLRFAQANDRVRIHYVGHSTFMLTSPAGVTIATDYNDYLRPRALPDIITMNRAHLTHYTDNPDPNIKHVLRGWSAEREKPVHHDFTLQDVRIRNVPTNIRVLGGSLGGEGTERHGNSIFVFEMAGLCIGHLGHLHHTLTQQQLNEMGRVDVLMVPVDGSFTLDREGMLEVIRAIKAPLVIPMHYFTEYTLNLFLQMLGKDFEIEQTARSGLTVSKATLPEKPKVVVLLQAGG